MYPLILERLCSLILMNSSCPMLHEVSFEPIMLSVNWMSFWKPCCPSLWICPPLFLWTCHLQPHSSSSLLWTPTSCRPRVDLWPIFFPWFTCDVFVHFSFAIFLFLAFLFLFLFFCKSLETPTFVSVRSVNDSHHTVCVHSVPNGRGEVALALLPTLLLCSSPSPFYLLFPSHNVLPLAQRALHAHASPAFAQSQLHLSRTS